ncbi:fimbrial protein [Pseudomonas fildesensis]|uniref:Fimbrial protein n=1 Tax=Pseudomonas fildesensis TaxID=1674920 RepID=A0A0J8G039_9PSED|nr:fimbrial protein [Pseudomonas fildesensis]KMT55917.1 fimbrial protein [Pseudomonas fildesensis]
MKHSIRFISALLVFGVPIAAQAACDTYMNSEHGLTLPAVITVPDSLPVGAEIIRRPFSNVVPARYMNCDTPTLISLYGRYSGMQETTYPYAYRTEAPGVGIRITITDARPGTSFYAFQTVQATLFAGRHPIYTNAEAVFYKIGPITGGTVPAAIIWQSTMRNAGPPVGTFRLSITSPIRFVSPATTCDLAAGDVNRTITLPPIRVGDLRNAVSAGAYNFELTANCTGATNVTYRFSGTPAAGNAVLFANTGTAGNVGLWLYSRINGANQNIGANNTSHTRTLVVSGNRAVLPLGAAYHRTGTVTQGTLVSTATVNITYN